MDNSTPKYVIVENHIRHAIKNKKIMDKLPGERALAKKLGFSYMTVRKAIENLVNEGLLYKIPTKGTFVANKKHHKKKTNNIGYFLDSSIVSGISSPYYSLIFNALQKEATANGYTLFYFSDQNQDILNETISKLDGVIASCFPRNESIIHKIKALVPVVVIDNSSADKSIPSVIIDNFNAILDSLEHLIELGHSRIGFMTGLEDSDVGKDRYAGYLNGISKHGINHDDSLVFKGNYSFESGIKGAAYFLRLKRPPTAIICANDSMALGAVKVIHQAGLNVPEDISVIGFDDIEVSSQVIPSLTTVVAPIEQIAKRSFMMLLQLTQNNYIENMHIALSAKLIIRQTCYNLVKHQVA